MCNFIESTLFLDYIGLMSRSGCHLGFNKYNCRPRVELEMEQGHFRTSRRARRRKQIYCSLHICACVSFWVTFSMIINGTIRVAVNLPYITNYESSLNDNEVLSVSTDDSLCSGLTLKDESLNSKATIYSLHRPPALDGFSNITVEANKSVSKTQEDALFWNGYLYHGSTIKVLACGGVEGEVRVIIFLSTNNFELWKANHASLESAHRYMNVTYACPQKQILEVQVPDDVDDQWYIVINNRNSGDVDTRVTAEVYRKVYTIKETDIINSCQAYGDDINECRIPTTHGATYLVTTSINSAQGYDQTVNVKVQCIVRKWLYAAIIVPLMLFLVILGVVTLFGVCYCRRKMREGAYPTPMPVIGQSGVDDIPISEKPIVNTSSYQPALVPLTGLVDYKPAYTIQ